MVEDPLRDRRLGDEGDELHPAVALPTGEHVDRKDLLVQIGPGNAVLRAIFAGFARSGFSVTLAGVSGAAGTGPCAAGTTRLLTFEFGANPP